MTINQGLSAASRILPIVDTENVIKDKNTAKDIKINNGDIKLITLFLSMSPIKKIF